MTAAFRRFTFLLVAPTLSVGLLAGMIAEKRTYKKESDFEPYHARCAQSIASLPDTIGPFTSVDREIERSAIKLLKPNKSLSRQYMDTERRDAHLMIVQCKQSSDMVGHYPPKCYVSSGWEMTSSRPRDWRVKAEHSAVTTIPGMEYQFTRVEAGQRRIKVVYNFMVVPQRGIQRDMSSVEAAAEDYQQRYFGAAQFHVVFDGSIADEPTRDDIFTTLMTPALPVLRTINDGELP